MLHSFKIMNFRSIVELEVNLSFAEGAAPNGYADMQTWPFLERGKHMSDRFVPCLAIYGANASGKSNIIKAMSIFNKIVSGQKATQHYQPNKLNRTQEATSFVAIFSDKSGIYEYSIKYNNTGIVYESLLWNKTQIYSINNLECSFKSLAKKAYSTGKLEDIFMTECVKDKKQHTAFIARITTQYTGLNKHVNDASAIIHSLWVFKDNQLSIMHGINMLADTYADEPFPNEKALVDITAILRKLDINIKKIDMYKLMYESGDPDDFWEEDGETIINSYHTDINGNEVEFNFFEHESDGTQTVAGLIGAILAVLKCGGVLIVDELDAHLHSLIACELINMFKDKRYNTTNAQLIFTAHNTDILDGYNLRISELGIVNKTIKQGTTFSRAIDHGITRNVKNLRKAYLNGELSGLPFPYI